MRACICLFIVFIWVADCVGSSVKGSAAIAVITIPNGLSNADVHYFLMTTGEVDLRSSPDRSTQQRHTLKAGEIDRAKEILATLPRTLAFAQE